MLDPDFRAFSFSDDVKALVRDLGFHTDPRVVQSMVICKNPVVGGAVNVHDDQTFLTTEPSTAMGLWFALEDATADNGCLSFVPGSHKTNRLTKRLVRVPGGGTNIVRVPGTEDVVEVDWEAPEVEWVAAPCAAGDLVLIHGAVIHRSERNLSDKSRFIYTVSGPDPRERERRRPPALADFLFILFSCSFTASKGRRLGWKTTGGTLPFHSGATYCLRTNQRWALLTMRAIGFNQRKKCRSRPYSRLRRRQNQSLRMHSRSICLYAT